MHIEVTDQVTRVDLGSIGKTLEERKAALWRDMAQLFDNNIMPYMRFKDESDVDKSDNYK